MAERKLYIDEPDDPRREERSERAEAATQADEPSETDSPPRVEPTLGTYGVASPATAPRGERNSTALAAIIGGLLVVVAIGAWIGLAGSDDLAPGEAVGTEAPAPVDPAPDAAPTAN